MSFFHASMLAGASGNQGPYEIEQSLRLNKTDQSYVNKVFTSAGDEQKFTISFWFKICQTGKSTADNLVGAGEGGSNFFLIDIEKTSVGEFLHITNYTPATGYEFDLKTNRAIRDPSAWMHLVLAVDTTQATASNRAKVWLNGVQETSFATENYPSQNGTAIWWGGNSSNGVALSSQETAIGRRPPGGPEYANAYIAEFNSIDGQYLTHEDFGEFDDNGVWRPIRYTGTYTGNSFYLKFDASDVDGDSSGLGNDFTANNITTSGTGTDVMSDTPTNNFCTINPLDGPTSTTLTYTEGNLTSESTSSSAVNMVNGTIGVTSGKWYWELTVVSGDRCEVGVALADATRNDYVGKDASGWSIYQLTGKKYHNGTGESYGSAWTTAGDVLQIALDVDNSKIWFGKNGTYFASGDPAAGTNAAYTNVTGGALFPSIGDGSTTGVYKATYNFGQRDFEYTPPTGFSALNTSNLPAPDIADGSEYFNTITYTGDGTSSHAITGVGFQPDWVWLKSRSLSQAGNLIDAVRGVDKYLRSSSTAAEATFDFLSSFDTDGFTLGTSDAGANQSSATYVAWNWLGANGTSSNTNGSITSTVSVSATSGFSIVSYGGNSTAGATVGHGLGVAPKAFVIKNRDDSVARWCMYHVATGATGYMRLDASAKFIPDGVFNSTAPSSTTFTVSSGYFGNRTGDNYIAYCFAEVEGYSKFGSYEGNNSSDGPFVATSFAPAWLLIKRFDADGYNWTLFDSERRTFNVNNHTLNPNNSNVEETAGGNGQVDFLSNGFKVRNTDGGVNASGGDYLYIAFASNPFGGSGVSPVTAR